MRSSFHRTLLHDAAMYNRTSCLRVLLRFAPHLVDAVNKHNETPLMSAVMMKGNRDTAKMLLRAGAFVRRRDIFGQTVFDYARKYHREEIL